MSRIDQLLQYLKEDPEDAFNLYAVAIEYSNTDPRKALEYYLLLREKHPDYLPTYYHLGKLLIELHDPGSAKETYKAGIAIAERTQEWKTLRELRNALSEVEWED